MSVAKYILLQLKKLKGSLNEKEKTDLQQWLSQKENAKVSKDIDKIWDLSGRYKDNYQPDVEAGIAKLKSRIQAEKSGKTIPLHRRNNSFARIAAAIVFLLALAWVWRTYLQNPTGEQVAQTYFNEQQTIHLADGSTVVLNQNSKLIYPNSFDGQATREVELQGEAYFDIESNPEVPFKIYTPEADVEVLGTSFNVRAYTEEDFTEVDVETGKVAFKSRDKSQKVILKPKEKAAFQHDGAMVKKEDSQLNAHSWRTRKLSFRNTALSEVLQAVERHFEVEFDISEANINSCDYTSNFEQEELDNILEAMATSFGISFNKEDKNEYKVIGKGLNCN